MQRTVGVIGGMGPEATAEFFQQIVRLTPAGKDQDHLQVIVLNNPRIPDRTAFLSGTGESPVPLLLDTAAKLKQAGADFLAIPCNTAHAFWNEISEHVQIPVLHIVRETAARIVNEVGDNPAGARIGVLATLGTIRAGLYQGILREYNLIPVLPGKLVQESISESIALIKSRRRPDDASRLIETSIGELAEEDVQGVVLGCTELGLVPAKSPVPVFDSLKILAESTVRFALDWRT